MDTPCMRSRVRTRTHGSVGRRRLRPPLTRFSGVTELRSAGNACPALLRGQPYSGLRRVVYNDESFGLGTI